MKTSTKLLSMFSAFCAILFLGMTANAQSITVVPGLTATQMAQTLVGANVTVTNATYTGATNASGSFNQASSTFPLTDGIILTSGLATNALGPNNSTGSSSSNGTAGDTDLGALVPGITTFDAAVLEFDITSNCTSVTFDYIFASEEYPEYGCSNFNDAFAFFISGPGFTPNTNIALVPGTTTPVSINNVINSPSTNCVSNPSYYVDNAGGVSVQYDGYTVVMTATATIQPCQTYHVKIVVGDAGDSALDSAIFLKGGGINCTSPSLATTANITDVACGGLGAIDLSVNSGTGPFTYAWTGPNGFTATTEDLTGLAAGSYTVDIVGSDCLSSGQATFTVADNADVTPPVFTNCPSDLVINAANNSCAFSVNALNNVTATDDCGVTSIVASPDSTYAFGVGTTPVTVTATDAAGNTSTCNFNVIINAQPLVVTLTPFQYNGGVNIRCYGQNSGRVTAGATGGCAPYTYTWSAGFPIPPTGTTCVGLFAGTVSCTVTDAAGTSVTETVTLVQNPPVVVDPSWTPIACYGGTSTVTINAQAGTSPYNGLTVSNLYAGTYEYVVADANGCRAFDTITITQPDILDVTATPDPILCYGDTTTVTVAGIGGTTPYVGTGNYQVVAGVYTYDIVDANGCTETTQLAVNQPGQLTAMISATPILCNGGTSFVTVTVASGTEPYTGTGIFEEEAGWHTYTVYDYNLCEDTIGMLVTEPSAMVSTLSATPILCNGDSTTITATGVGGTGAWTGTGTFTGTAGTYDYVFTDANGCTDSNSITLTEPTALVVSTTSTSIDCNGGTADITVSATGGTASYTGTGTFTVTAGTYDYTVTDANGCSETVTVTVTEPTALVASATSTSIDCNGGTADITVTATGGTPSYTGTGTFTVTAGTYTYTVTDVNGCTSDVTLTVTEPTALSASVTSTSIDCNGGTADITVSATGGTPSYTGTGTFTVSAGTYTYTVTDANGCSEDVTITVTEPAALVASATATSILCNGGTADVTVTATGGTPSYTGTGTFTVSAGSHTFTVTDANGCTSDVTVTVTEPAALLASATATSILCNGGTADVTVSATGGTGSYTGTGSFTGLSAGTYYYTVTDVNGCSSTASVTITEPSALSATATVAALDCSSLTADVTIVATGGTAPYTGDGVINQGLGATTYTVTDANGCTVTVSATVEVENFVDLTCLGNQTYACNYAQNCGSQTTGSIISWDEPTASSFSTCDNGCGPNTAIAGFIYMGEYNGSRYYCSNTSNYSWQAANTAAINAGGHLATIQSAGENQFISSQIMANVAWIGFTDQNVEGTFEWSNGENVGYTNWGGYEPNNNGPTYTCGYCGEADYTVISSSQGGWYDRYECNLNEFVMEIPCGNPITITQTSGPANGSYAAGGTTQTVTYVATDDVTGATATCSFTVHVEKCTPVYCESEGYCTAYEWIDQVGLESINNQSGNDNGYGDYTTLATGAFAGDVINLTLTPGFSGQSYTEAWRVWVDWNYDGDFYDQGEMVYQGYGSSALTGSFTVPSFATLNEDLRVRVSMRWNCYPGPCSTYQYGEVEDYTIFIQDDNGGIGGMQTVIGQNENADLKQGNTALDNVKMYEDVVEDTEVGGIGLEIGDIYPNPVLATNGEFNVEVRVGHKSDVTVRIVDLSGKVLLTDLMHLETGANKRTMNVTGFARGSYLIEVISGDLKETTQLIVQ